MTHLPTDITKSDVCALTSFGHTQEEIASHLGISIDTLQRKYSDELKNSILRANAKVAAKLFRKATEDDDLTAMIFWLKTRARWRDRDSYDERYGNNSHVDDDCKKRFAEMDAKNRKDC